MPSPTHSVNHRPAQGSLSKGKPETGISIFRSQVSAVRSQVQAFSTWYRFRTRTRTCTW